MGYACPVCGAEQADGVHLANHLAITASLGRPDHEAWLTEYAPDWADDDPETLAERVVPHAEEIETPDFATDDGARPETGFERDLAARTRGPGRGDLTGAGRGGRGPPGGVDGPSEDVESVLAEARELTARMRAEPDDETDEAGTERPRSVGERDEQPVDATSEPPADGSDDALDPSERERRTADRDRSSPDGDENA